MAGKGDSVRTIFFALGANFAIFIAKSVAAVITGSGAMLAEAVHSLADCGNQVLLIYGAKAARRPATHDNPLGFGKAIYFWSFLVALMLFTVGGLFSVYQGIQKFDHPHEMEQPWLAFAVLAFAMLAEGTALRACLKIVEETRGERTLWQWFRTTRQADLVVIFGEDSAALAGLILAAVAIALTVYTGNPMFDAVGTLAIGVLLILVAIFVGIEIQAMLIGQSVSPATQARMQEFLEAREEVDQVYSLITLQLGKEAMVAVKARMRPASTPEAMIADINRTEAALKAEFPQIRWSFFEPDVED
jgi:cation diffusion facilitator family transporter